MTLISSKQFSLRLFYSVLYHEDIGYYIYLAAGCLLAHTFFQKVTLYTFKTNQPSLGEMGWVGGEPNPSFK